MKRKKLSKRFAATALAVAMVVIMPLIPANLQSEVRAGSELDTSEMTEKEKEAYELTKYYASHLPKVDTRVKINPKYFKKLSKSDSKKASNLDSSYNAGKKKVNVSSVKDQSSTSLCWDFSFLEAAQDSLRAKDNTLNPDFSEAEIGYFIYNKPVDRLGLLEGDSTYSSYTPGTSEYYGIGGNESMVTFAASQGLGLKDESSAPFTDLIEGLYTSGKYTLPDSTCYRNNIYSLSGAEIYNTHDENVRNEIKQKIIENGAGQSSYTQNEGSFDYSTFAYYTAPEVDTEPSGGHAIAIVGWDDNYSVDNFRYAPEKKGAWLIKNSWGTTWGLDGYFWMSYYEPTLEDIYFYDLEETGSYDNIYQYDGTLLYNVIPGNVGIKTTANIFTAQKNETINAVSFFTVEDDTTSNIFIYKNENPMESPSDGKLVFSDTNYAKHMGYTKYDIPAEKTIKLKKGDSFSVVIEQSVAGNPSAIFIDEDYSYDWMDAKNASEPGQSYLSFKSSDWDDWMDASEHGTNFRIKAFTAVDETATGSELSFDQDEYNVKIGESVTADVRLDDNSIQASANLSFDSADESVAFVTDMGKIFGRDIGSTEITVKYGDKTKTAKVNVVNNPDMDSITIDKEDGYATEDNPFTLTLGSDFSPKYTVIPSKYSGKEKYGIEVLDKSVNPEYAYTTTGRGNYKFYKSGKYKITVTVDGQGDVKGASQEFYVEAKVDSTDCSNDVTEIAASPYACLATKIYRYNGKSDGYCFNMSYDIEQDYDYMYVFGMDSPDISDQEIYDYFRAGTTALRDDYYDISDEDYEEDDVVLVDVLTGVKTDYKLKVPYKYVAFVMYADQYQDGSFGVDSVEPYTYVPAENITMKASDMTPFVKAGDTADYKVTLLPAEAVDEMLYCESENEKIASAEYNSETCNLSITGKKIGTTDIYLYLEKDDKKNAKSAEDAVEGNVTGRALKLTVTVTSESAIPDSFTFDYTGSKFEIERNSTQQIKYNSDEWLNYDIEYDNPDPTIAYINNGELVAVSTGETKIKATVNAGLGNANPTSELTVTVKAPETESVDNLQTIHNIVPGMDETYTYKAPEGTECMKLYFDAKTSFRSSDKVIIKDGKGNYYGLDIDDRIITTKDDIESEEVLGSDDYYEYYLIPEVLTDYTYTIYDDEVSIRFISLDSSNNNNDSDDIYRGNSYGFRVKKIETGKAATGIEIENSEINLDFSTFNSNKARIQAKLIPEEAIDNICYDVENSNIATVDRYGTLKGLVNGETDFAAYTANPDVKVAAVGKLTVSSDPINSVTYADDSGNDVTEEDETDIFVTPCGESCFYVKVNPWNLSEAISLEYDRSSFLIYKTITENGMMFNFTAPEMEGVYKVDVNMTVKNEAGEVEKQVVHVFNVNVLLGEENVPKGYDTFKAKKFINDANGDINPEDLTAEDITLGSISGNSGYWTYKKPDADYVELTFTEDSEIGAGTDWIFIYDLEGKLVGAYTGDKNLMSDYIYAGKTIRIEGEGFILGYVGDNSGLYNGFEVASISAHVQSTEPTPTATPTATSPSTPTAQPTATTPSTPTAQPTATTPSTPTAQPTATTPSTPAVQPTATSAVTPTVSPSKTEPEVGSIYKTSKAKFKILSKSTVAYAGPVANNPKTVTIPATVKIDGKSYKVTEISVNALKNKKNLKKVVIGKNIKTIGKSAFYGCKNLKTIIINGKALKKVKKNAIKNINSKAVIKAPKAKLGDYKKLFTAKTGYKKKTMKIKKR
ncbi:Leucine rich repeat-containing protein [Lachnospiraceae bacterium]|nr:Leucine rich repeat-containing protein [Lachnospiraceae bacterium]